MKAPWRERLRDFWCGLVGHRSARVRWEYPAGTWHGVCPRCNKTVRAAGP